MDQVVCSLALCPIKNWNWAFLNQESANYLCIQIAPDPELFTPIISGSGDMRERKWLSRMKKFVKMLFKIFLKVLSKICSAKNVSLWTLYKPWKSYDSYSLSFLWNFNKHQIMQHTCKFAAWYSISKNMRGVSETLDICRNFTTPHHVFWNKPKISVGPYFSTLTDYS